ncbi:MAG: DUF3267 domain-containing protein [Clostridiales bacterium]|jgi:hypothetical protein|nr:DUF3267 domain-containing protein [Clostridiales bacterium]
MRIEVENDQVRARKKQEYEDLVMEMDKNGYETRLEKISVLAANVFGLVVMFGLAAALYPLYILIYGKEALSFQYIMGFPGMRGTLFLLVLFFATIFIHEFIHGFFWHFACKEKWKSIDFGFNPKNITPYCHCREPLWIPQYFFGCIAPTLLLGVLPIVLGFVFQVLFLVTLGIIGVVGGCGDLMVIWTLRRHKNCMLFDHPYEVGYAYFVKK